MNLYGHSTATMMTTTTTQEPDGEKAHPSCAGAYRGALTHAAPSTPVPSTTSKLWSRHQSPAEGGASGGATGNVVEETSPPCQPH
jgi:hypothetical protein